MSDAANPYLDPFERLLADVADRSLADAWRAVEESGFLDMLRPEAADGAGAPLDDVLALALALGRAASDLPVLETMIARGLDPDLGPGPALLGSAAGFPEEVAAAARVVSASRSDDRVGTLAAASLAARMAGAMERVQALCVDYVGARQQFGRPIGRFQAVQHQLAVMAEEVEAARTAAALAFSGSLAAFHLATGALAKMRAGEAAVSVAAIAHAVHGAIGVSEAYALQRYTRRLHAWDFAHGGAGFWATRLGRHVLSERGTFLDMALELRPAG